MKEFFFVFVMSHYHGRYKSEEISPGISAMRVIARTCMLRSVVTFPICHRVDKVFIIGHLNIHVAEVQWVFNGELPVVLVTLPGDVGYWFAFAIVGTTRLEISFATYLKTCRPNSQEHAGKNKKEKDVHPSFLPCCFFPLLTFSKRGLS